MNVKVVIKQSVLRGSEYPEKIATVYINRKEFRVYAPPEAKGDALDWLEHCFVHEPAEGGEIETIGTLAVFVIRSVRDEIEKKKEGAHRADGVHPDGVHASAQICLNGHVRIITAKPSIQRRTALTAVRLALTSVRAVKIRFAEVDWIGRRRNMFDRYFAIIVVNPTLGWQIGS